MPRGIESDWKDFRDLVDGKIRKALKKFIRTKITKTRAKNGKVSFAIPTVDQPHLVYGNPGEGVGRGPGKKGDVIDKGKGKGKGKGKAGNSDEEVDGIMITFDLEEVLKFLQDDLQLPNLKPKPNETFDEIKIRYNNISLIGPESLRHNKRTFLQAIKRQASMGTLDQLHHVPGMDDPITIIQPWKTDKRYRQFNEIKIPSSNALVVYARDGSYSMDEERCEIVSDMAWWIDVWVKRFYERTETMYVWHDNAAQEVDEEKFYKYRGGGGTTCSSALKYIDSQLENRFNPQKWNIFIFYFTDGDNWSDDNPVFINTLKEQFSEHIVNFVGITQVLADSYQDSLKYEVDEAVRSGELNGKIIRTAAIAKVGKGALADEDRNEQILNAIKHLMGSTKSARDNE